MDEQFSVKSKPPYKQAHANEKERKDKERYKQACTNAARRCFLTPAAGDLKLEVRYQRFRGRMDSANIIGGIADALNKIAYRDDIQLREIQYAEVPGTEDTYSVRVLSLGSTP